MPLKKGSSNATRSENIREMVEAGHPQKQAVAAAYREQRSSRGGARGAKHGSDDVGGYSHHEHAPDEAKQRHADPAGEPRRPTRQGAEDRKFRDPDKRDPDSKRAYAHESSGKDPWDVKCR